MNKNLKKYLAILLAVFLVWWIYTKIYDYTHRVTGSVIENSGAVVPYRFEK